jgi:hypothetical protein
MSPLVKLAFCNLGGNFLFVLKRGKILAPQHSWAIYTNPFVELDWSIPFQTRLPAFCPFRFSVLGAWLLARHSPGTKTPSFEVSRRR